MEKRCQCDAAFVLLCGFCRRYRINCAARTIRLLWIRDFSRFMPWWDFGIKLPLSDFLGRNWFSVSVMIRSLVNCTVLLCVPQFFVVYSNNEIFENWSLIDFSQIVSSKPQSHRVSKPPNSQNHQISKNQTVNHSDSPLCSQVSNAVTSSIGSKLLG